MIKINIKTMILNFLVIGTMFVISKLTNLYHFSFIVFLSAQIYGISTAYFSIIDEEL